MKRGTLSDCDGRVARAAHNKKVSTIRTTWPTLALVFSMAATIGFSAEKESGQSDAKETDGALKLWYRHPAANWNEALPIGNGSFGAMVFGGVAEERIQFNHDTLWSGEPGERVVKGAAEILPELRRLLFTGKQ